MKNSMIIPVLLSAVMLVSGASAVQAFAQDGASSAMTNAASNVRLAEVNLGAQKPRIRRIVQPVPKTISLKGGSFVVKCKGMSVDTFKSQPLYKSNMPVMSGGQKAVKIRQLNRHENCQSQRLTQS